MHYPKPFFRKSRKLWYVQIEGYQHNLGPDREQAFEAYHELMRQVPKRVDPRHVVALIDQYLQWVETNRSSETYDWYQFRLESFGHAYPTLLVGDLKPFHVQQWIDGMKLSSGSKHNYARSIMRCMAWCEEQGLIEKNPIRHFKKPRAGKREKVVSPEEYLKILGVSKRPQWQDMIRFAWNTGARAAELLAVEKQHIDLPNHRIVLPVSEEKMGRAPRIIYLSEEAEEIIRRLVVKHPTGKLFRNSAGKAWTTAAVNCAFVRAQKKLGVKYCLTVFRHSWCHRMLKAGVDALTVSVLMGHAGLNMTVSVYSHLSHAPQYLLESVRKVG